MAVRNDCIAFISNKLAMQFADVVATFLYEMFVMLN